MPDLTIKLPVFTARLDDGGVFACPLHFPGLSALAEKRATSIRHLEAIVKRQSARAWGHMLIDPVVRSVDRLHRRYATYSANPGRPLTFLRNLLDGGGELDESRVTESFSDQTGLPLAPCRTT